MAADRRSARTVTGPDELRPRREPSSAPPRAASLRLFREGAEPVDIELSGQSRTLIGRHDGVDVCFESSEVSRMHGALACEDGRWTYTDLGSSNGSALLTQAEAARGDAGQPSPLHAMDQVALDIGDQVLLGGWGSRIELRPPLPPPAAKGDATLRSAAGRAFADNLALAARTKVPVFLLGASGTGKTHAARQIHVTPDAPFVLLNCARLSQDPALLHSELLGHVKGAFTGAAGARTGSFYAAQGGTLCLDEVESLAPAAQGFLLDILEGTGDPSPMGSPAGGVERPAFRLVSCSKVALDASGLRADLCERLAEGHLWRVPALAERTDDIPGLLQRFADEQTKMLGVSVSLTDEALAWAQTAPWPGEIRQLRATVAVLAQAAVASSAGPVRRVVIRTDDLQRHVAERNAVFARSTPEPQAPQAPAKRFARSLTRDDVQAALRAADGNQSAAARSLGIARNTLAKKMRDFGLD
jgi:transcriptional regulator with AAA-type ATPase domain